MSAHQWNESEPSDDEVNQETLATRKRSSRACDQCRKTKSKCEPSGTAGTCKSCTIAGNSPSYKRGPPKGYIQAIEQRWHQVESLLGAVLSCPDTRVRQVIADIRQDDLAREILNRVDTGPFGPSGRLSQPAGATKEDFFACIFRSNEASARDSPRSRRQSRISREIVSSSRDNTLSTIPTSEWQDRLSASLTRGPVSRHGVSPAYNLSGAPLQQRRRLDVPPSSSGPHQPNWNEMYTMDALSDSDGTDESNGPGTAFGQLSLDENQEVRYHGKVSGLHLLGRSSRLDSRHEGGIWKLPMARFWPSAKPNIVPAPPVEGVVVNLPPLVVQDHLVDLYFTYVHPVFPVIHKGRFLREYSECNPTTPEAARGTPYYANPEPSQNVTRLLLLAIFAIAARYLDDNTTTSVDAMWEAGNDYLAQARAALAQVYHSSRATTCQALLLLGHREFGIGSMEQGWLYIGMAIRMAQDLGLNRAADNWQLHGRKMFSLEENQVRKHIWWGCCIADKRLLHHYVRIPYLQTVCKPDGDAAVLIGSIVTMIYPVRSTGRGSRRAVLNNLESRLDQWYIDLPDNLRYDPASKRNTPPPAVLCIHIKYWSAVLLLHRAFSEQILQNPPNGSDTASLKAFDLCQSAATYVSTIVTTYHENFNIKCSSPFLSSYILSAGFVSSTFLTLRPSNVQAYIGLRQCLAVLKEMQTTWPSAGRAHDLLNGVRVQVDSNMPPLVHGPDRAPDVLQREAFGDVLQMERAPQNSGIQEISTRMMAHMLGLDIPGIEPSTSYYPGYEWWPRANQPSPHASSLTNMDYPLPNDQDWRVQNPTSNYSYEYQNAPPDRYRM
ncbi:fungal-specific transcription factor domain-containing protein [Suillus lakei]|nr:fungal-specific transcription factor domain-containing protein [Suillus lakei]